MGRALPGVIQCLKSQGGPTSDSARVVLRASTKPAQTPALPAASLHCSPLDFVTATKQNQWEGLGNLCKSLTTALWHVSYQAGTVLVSTGAAGAFPAHPCVTAATVFSQLTPANGALG